MKVRFLYTGLVVLLSCCIIQLSNAKAQYATPDALRAIENGSVYSFCQDLNGAIWMNTNYGLCRYNGKKVDYVYGQVPYNNISGNGKDLIYVPGISSILKFNIKDNSPVKLRGANIDYPRSVVLADADSVFVASGNRIYSSSGKDTLVICMSVPVGEEIKDLKKTLDGDLLAATSGGSIYLFKKGSHSYKRVFKTEDSFSALYFDEQGELWAGLFSNGVLKLDQNYQETARYSYAIQDGIIRPLREARTFCEDIYRNIYVGTIEGLFVITHNGVCMIETDYSPQGHSICSLFKDRDNNIWLGTFYNGVFLCEINNSPFTSIKTNDSVKLVNSMVEDKMGDIWIVTDHYGLWKYRTKDKSCTVIPKTLNRKFKSAYYDKNDDSIWIGEYNGSLNNYNTTTGKWSEISLVSGLNEVLPISIYEIRQYGKDLYLASGSGVYIYTPDKERVISRKVPGYNGHTYSISFDENGTLWICGHELMSYTRSEGLQRYEELSTDPCTNILCGKDGEIALAILGKGFLTFKDGQTIVYDNKSIGLADEYAYLIDQINDNLLIGGTRTGLSIIDKAKVRCYNYGSQNCLGLSSAREGCILHKSDGTIWIGGTDGIVSVDPSNILLPSRQSTPYFEHCNPPLESGEITLRQDQRSLTVGVTNFDYSGIIPVKMEYNLEGIGDTWQVFDAAIPLTFSNLRPGKYTLRVRQSEIFSSEEYTENQLKVTVKSVWYFSTLAIISYIIVILSIAIWLVTVSYSRKILSKELKIKEKESNDRMRFFINISHELRTPLTMIIGQLELFLRSKGPRSTGIKNIESSHNQAKKMQQLVSDLLDFEKQNQGHASIKICRTDLCSFLSKVREDFSQYAIFRNISLSFKLPPVKVFAMMDYRQMQSVFSNLLINSFKYTPDGGSITVSLNRKRTDGDDGKAVIVISDSGKGISGDALDKIFDPFYQDPLGNSWERRNQGTGIGLALCKSIIELHHGAISVSNNEKGGASFTIELPLGNKWYLSDPNISVLDGNDEVELSKINITIPEVDRIEQKWVDMPTNHKMLIVEDDPDMQSMLVSIFEHKYNIITASDGTDGLIVAKQSQPDIIISDVMMPIMDGITFCANLRKDFETCHIPIILLTAHTSLKNNIEGMDMGADDYISKPFSIELLKARCENLLENRKMLRQKFEKDFTGVDDLVKTGADKKFISSVIDVINANLFSQNLNVNMLCQELNISRTLLDKKLKGITGSSPREFIENIKLKQAARLLKDSDMNVSEIAYELGYSSPKYFTLRFKKMFDVTPTDYKK